MMDRRVGGLVLVGWLLTTSVQAQQAVRSPEAALYQTARSGTFRVEAGIEYGTGFLVDSQGDIVTNDHVIGIAGADVSVYVDSLTRVPAVVVARDADADIAIVRIASNMCHKCQPLELAPAPLVLVPGDRVVALGYPLGQPLTLTTGYVGNIRGSALRAEVPINPGNSGGPLFTMDGRVVAVNTFREADEIGAGLSGGVLVDRVHTLLAEAQRSTATPVAALLPAIPLDLYKMRTLKAVADTTDPLFYRQLSSMDAGAFSVTVSTPLSGMVRSVSQGREMTVDRTNREAKAKITPADRYSDLAQLRDWMDYIGDPTVPVVAIRVEPKIGETLGSALGRALTTTLIGWADAATIKFQGDVRRVTLKRDGRPVAPLRGGHGPVSIYVDNQYVRFKDVADMGYYIYPFEAFRPARANAPPTMTLEIEDLKSRNVSTVTLSSYAVARTWNDFEGYVQQSSPSESFVRHTFILGCAVKDGATAMGGAAPPVQRVRESDSEACVYNLAAPSPLGAAH